MINNEINPLAHEMIDAFWSKRRSNVHTYRVIKDLQLLLADSSPVLPRSQYECFSWEWIDINSLRERDIQDRDNCIIRKNYLSFSMQNIINEEYKSTCSTYDKITLILWITREYALEIESRQQNWWVSIPFPSQEEVFSEENYNWNIRACSSFQRPLLIMWTCSGTKHSLDYNNDLKKWVKNSHHWDELQNYQQWIHWELLKILQKI